MERAHRHSNPDIPQAPVLHGPYGSLSVPAVSDRNVAATTFRSVAATRTSHRRHAMARGLCGAVSDLGPLQRMGSAGRDHAVVRQGPGSTFGVIANSRG